MIGVRSILWFLVIEIQRVYGALPQVTQVNVPFVLVGTEVEDAMAALKRFATSAQTIMNCALNSDPGKVLATAEAAKQSFLDAATHLTAARKEMIDAHKKQRELDIAEHEQSEVVQHTRDAVANEEGHIREVKAQIQSLHTDLNAELSAIDSMADQIRSEKQSVELRQKDLAEKLDTIRKKEKELQKLKGSFEGIDGFQVEREEHDVKILKRDYDAAKKTLDADEARLRGGMQRMDKRADRWADGKDLIREAHDHLSAAELALKQRQESLALNEAALQNLHATIRDHVALVKSVEVALSSAEDDMYSAASSGASAQNTAIGTMHAEINARDEEIKNQQAALEDALVKHEKLESELRRQQKDNAVKDTVAHGLKGVVDQHAAALDHANQAAAFRESQVEALRNGVAGKVFEVGKLRADNAVLDDNAGQLREKITQKTFEIQNLREKSTYREAQIDVVNAEAAHQEDKYHTLEAHISEVNADTDQTRNAVTRHDETINSQSRELEHQDEDLRHLAYQKHQRRTSNNELRGQNAEKRVQNEVMKDTVVQRDEVMDIQGHELKQQDVAIKRADEVNAAKDASIKALRKEGAEKDAMAQNFQKVLDEQKASEDKIREVIDASRKQLMTCQGKGYEGHLHERLGDFIDVLSKSKPKGAALQVSAASRQAPRSQRLSLKSKEVASQLAVRAHSRTGCFFWESDCVMSEVMCGADNMIHADVKLNKCKRFIYFFNHANDHCSVDETRLSAYKECFWTELKVHVPARDKCTDVCSDAHGKLPKDIERCEQQCVHTHDCTDVCNTDKYKFRDAISECFLTCMDRSPVNPVGTCRGSCGGLSPNMKCHCDPTCVHTNDCCKDYENFCLVGGLQWNESLPLPNTTFNLPAFNVSKEDVEQMGEKHKQIAKPADVSNEVEKQARIRLHGEQMREKSAKKRAEALRKAQGQAEALPKGRFF